jgi:WD40 repeat protein
MSGPCDSRTFALDGTTCLATASLDNTVRIWDPAAFPGASHYRLADQRVKDARGAAARPGSARP